MNVKETFVKKKILFELKNFQFILKKKKKFNFNPGKISRPELNHVLLITFSH